MTLAAVAIAASLAAAGVAQDTQVTQERSDAETQFDPPSMYLDAGAAHDRQLLSDDLNDRLKSALSASSPGDRQQTDLDVSVKVVSPDDIQSPEAKLEYLLKKSTRTVDRATLYWNEFWESGVCEGTFNPPVSILLFEHWAKDGAIAAEANDVNWAFNNLTGLQTAFEELAPSCRIQQSEILERIDRERQAIQEITSTMREAAEELTQKTEATPPIGPDVTLGSLLQHIQEGSRPIVEWLAEHPRPILPEDVNTRLKAELSDAKFESGTIILRSGGSNSDQEPRDGSAADFASILIRAEIDGATMTHISEAYRQTCDNCATAVELQEAGRLIRNSALSRDINATNAALLVGYRRLVDIRDDTIVDQADPNVQQQLLELIGLNLGSLEATTLALQDAAKATGYRVNH